MKLLVALVLSTGIFMATEAISASPPARWLWVASLVTAVWRADWMYVSGMLRLLPYRDAALSPSDAGEGLS